MHLLMKAGVIPWHDVRIRTCWGDAMKFPLQEDGQGVFLYYAGTLDKTELGLTAYLLKNLTAADVFYDVGSNYGFYAILAAKCDATVYAFEPNPSVYPYLEANIAAYPNAYGQNIAVSDSNGTMPFYDAMGFYNFMSTGRKDIAAARFKKYVQVEVPTIPLDEFAQKNSPPTYIKIDIEGAEADALKGAYTLLKSEKPPIVAMEVLLGELYTKETLKALSILSETGYSAWQITNNGYLISAGSPLLLAHNESADRNYIFIR